MRIVTRPDFDGVVCAALIFEAEPVTRPTLWVEPNEMQAGDVEIRPGDIVANLPFHPGCGIWFDHHYTNKPDRPFRGAYRIAPSAAGIVFEYYRDRFQRDYSELVAETDRIDAADLTLDQVLHPEDHPYILLSMTISNPEGGDEAYWNRVVDLLRHSDIHETLADPQVRERCGEAMARNRAFRDILLKHTRMEGHVSITDFREYEEEAPRGNRFLVYSLFPDAVVSVKVRNADADSGRVIIGVGHSIFNRNCNVNVGLMLSRFNGGGHRGAGSCTVPAGEADAALRAIVDILLKNVSNEPE
jgi:hypothetical protein